MDLQALYEELHGAAPQEAQRAARRFGASRDAPVWAVSACLLGIPCRYDGTHKGGMSPERLLQGKKEMSPRPEVLPLCPEVLAGLGVPRPPMVFEDGDGTAALAGAARLLDEHGRDCTAQLAAGAALAVRLARAAGCVSALLKARSPSCGVHQVHTKTGLVPGCGMFTAACTQAGILVRSDEA